jgi:hypothetical protein
MKASIGVFNKLSKNVCKLFDRINCSVYSVGFHKENMTRGSFIFSV